MTRIQLIEAILADMKAKQSPSSTEDVEKKYRGFLNRQNKSELEKILAARTEADATNTDTENDTEEDNTMANTTTTNKKTAKTKENKLVPMPGADKLAELKAEPKKTKATKTTKTTAKTTNKTAKTSKSTPEVEVTVLLRTFTGLKIGVYTGKLNNKTHTITIHIGRVGDVEFNLDGTQKTLNPSKNPKFNNKIEIMAEE